MASIPRANAPISNSDGSPTREWYNYLRANLSPSDLTTVDGEITVIAEKLGSPDGTVQNIPPISAGGTIVAQQSIAAVGSFPGAVILSLVNDQAYPGNTYFYGTDPAGNKGWVSLTTALDQASIGNLGDVDTTTTAPTDGQVLTWVNADSKWEPRTPTGGSLPPGGTTGQVLTKLSATDGDADWRTPAIGGGYPPDYGADPHFADTIFLLQCHDPYFWLVDSLGLPVQIGGASFSNAMPLFGNSSLSTARASAHPSVIPDSRWNLGTGDFTIEAMVYQKSFAASYWPNIIGRLIANNNKESFNLYFNETKGINLDVGTTGSSFLTIAGLATVAPNAWHEVAAVRASGVVTIYLDGIAIVSGAFSGAVYHDTTTACQFGQGSLTPSSNSGLDGYIGAVRITKYARYTTNYARAVAPWPNHP